MEPSTETPGQSLGGILKILLGLAVLGGMVGTLIFFIPQLRHSILNTIDQKAQQEVTTKLTTKNQPLPTSYASDNFTIRIPQGWITSERIPSTILTLTNPNQKSSTSSAARRINFKSYLAITEGITQGQTLDQVVDFVQKTELKATPKAQTLTSKKESLSGFASQLIEASLTQQGIDLHELLAVVLNKDKYFIVSCKVVSDEWPSYEKGCTEAIYSFQARNKK